MGMLLPHKMLLNYNVDEAIETLPISYNVRLRVDRCLMFHAPTAYQAPGVPLESIWEQLPTDVQEALNNAAIRIYELSNPEAHNESFADAYYKRQAELGEP